MALTRREMNLLILTIAAIVILLADSYILSPVLEARGVARDEKAAVIDEMTQNKEIIETSGPIARRKWKMMLEDGMAEGAAESESMIINYLNDLSSDHGVSLSSIQPEYGEKEEGIGVIEFIIAGNGHALDSYEFIWNIESTKMPLKIESVHLSSKDTNSGQVSIQLKISSIYSYEMPAVEEEI